jgi:hypothetical protein
MGETDSRRFTYGIPYGRGYGIYSTANAVRSQERRIDKALTSGPVFGIWRQETRHVRARTSTTCLLELNSIQKEGEDAISETKEAFERYGVSRSFRRGSNTQAINQGVSESDIDHNNRCERKSSQAGNRCVANAPNSQRSSDTRQRSNSGVHMPNDGSPGMTKGATRREEDLGTRGGGS